MHIKESKSLIMRDDFSYEYLDVVASGIITEVDDEY